MSQNSIYLFSISFAVGSESGIALVAASDERRAIQILKSNSSRRCEELTIKQTRNLGFTSSCTFGLLMESYVNAKEAYDAIMRAANKLKGEDGKSAGFGDVTASIDNSGESMIPDVSVEVSGEDSAKNIHFEFKNLKTKYIPVEDLSYLELDELLNL